MPRVLRWGALALALLASQQAAACVNSFGTDRNGHRFDSLDYTGDDLASMLTNGASRSYWVREADRYRDQAIEAPSYENATNYGVSLLYGGHIAPAMRLFLRLEQLYPGKPQTAANLGAALELAGQDAVALKWIRIGMRRDAGEHRGTEWLHGRILEAKLADASSKWDRTRSIAGITFTDAFIPALPRAMPAGNDGKPVAPNELDRAFRYQLAERMQFVKPKDWVVANLLSDWATLNLAGGPIENAKVLHGLALRYGEPQTLQWARRTAHVDRVLSKARDARDGEADCAICERPPRPPPPPPERA